MYISELGCRANSGSYAKFASADVSEFIRNFDAGKYPELVAKP